MQTQLEARIPSEFERTTTNSANQLGTKISSNQRMILQLESTTAQLTRMRRQENKEGKNKTFWWLGFSTYKQLEMSCSTATTMDSAASGCEDALQAGCPVTTLELHVQLFCACFK